MHYSRSISGDVAVDLDLVKTPQSRRLIEFCEDDQSFSIDAEDVE